MEIEIYVTPEINDKKGNTSICRICWKSGVAKFKSLFDKFKNLPLFDHINILTNIEIKLNDGLPDTICSTCYKELETAVKFKEKCENANCIFKNKDIENILKGEDKYSEITVKNEPDEFAEESDDAEFNISIEYPEDKSLKSKSLDRSDKKKPSTETTVQCHDCGSYFKSKCKLRVHWKRTHLLNSLICSACKRTFKSYKAYHSHMSTKKRSCTSLQSNMIDITGIGKARLFYCKECPYKTKRIKDIQNHIVIHNGDRPYKCDICLKTFTQLSTVQNHKEMVHKKYKVEITCQICGKSVRGRSQVYRHIRSHDKVQCPICEKSMSRLSQKQHMQRHSGSKSFTCEVCALAFYTAAELYNHRRNHNKDKPTLKYEVPALDPNSPKIIEVETSPMEDLL
ncbi:Zinc finger protein 510 [Papilio xuthus]|uniref:Zinc finger protein 510 n=1 Tax=Papilio xuthus TaxID=66420 RepID=A0A194PWB1_PAPXU|nr:Zinc finger protein 510 [Papilio xuthus]